MTLFWVSGILPFDIDGAIQNAEGIGRHLYQFRMGEVARLPQPFEHRLQLSRGILRYQERNSLNRSSLKHRPLPAAIKRLSTLIFQRGCGSGAE